MADIEKAVTPLKTFGDRGVVCVWTGITQNSTFAGANRSGQFENPTASDRSVQVTGTFGASASLKLQGSNDGSTWADLHDTSGAVINFTASGLVQIHEVTRFVRPLMANGDGNTSLEMTLLAMSRF